MAPPRLVPVLALSAFLLVSGQLSAGVDRWTPLGPDGGAVTALAAPSGVRGLVFAGTAGWNGKPRRDAANRLKQAAIRPRSRRDGRDHAETAGITASQPRITAIPHRITVIPDRITVNPDRITVNPDWITVIPDRIAVIPDRITVIPDRIAATRRS